MGTPAPRAMRAKTASLSACNSQGDEAGDWPDRLPLNHGPAMPCFSAVTGGLFRLRGSRIRSGTPGELETGRCCSTSCVVLRVPPRRPTSQKAKTHHSPFQSASGRGLSASSSLKSARNAKSAKSAKARSIAQRESSFESARQRRLLEQIRYRWKNGRQGASSPPA